MERSRYQRPPKTLWKRVFTPKFCRKLRYPWGRATIRFRQLPGAIVIGTQKGGTSFLFRCLVQHPRFFRAINKEIHFFDYRYEKGLEWYRAMFPFRGLLPEGSITGEATPFYMYHPLVPARVHDCLPEAKLIVLLRDPVERALSHYYHNVRRGREDRPIKVAFEAEQDMIREERDRLMAGEIFKPHNYRHFSYTERGLYAEQLERWFAHYPRDRIFIGQSETLYRDPHVFLEKLFRFLSIDPLFRVPDLTPSNVGIERGEDAEMREWLSDYFKPHNRALERLLGRSFGWSGQSSPETSEDVR